MIKRVGMEILCVAMCLVCLRSAAEASDEAVVSQNVVGVMRLEIPQGFSLVSTPLNRIGGDIQSLSDVFGNQAPVGTQLIFFSPDNEGMPYESVTYYGEGQGWRDDESFAVSDPEVPRGSGFWVNSASAFTLLLTGEVPLELETTVSLQPGYQIVSFAFPADEDAEESGLLPSVGDQVIRYDPEAGDYEYLTYYGAGPGWRDDDTFDAVVLQFSPGSAFWYNAGVTFDWNQERPY